MALINNEIIIKQDKHYIADKHASETFQQLIKYLKSRDLLEETSLQKSLRFLEESVDYEEKDK